MRIKDINDSAPIFSARSAIRSENDYSQSFKSDAQEDGVSISYGLSGADASNFLLTLKLVVTANAAMDYEASREFNFSIIATAIKTNQMVQRASCNIIM